jgi:hypothetical protein
VTKTKQTYQSNQFMFNRRNRRTDETGETDETDETVKSVNVKHSKSNIPFLPLKRGSSRGTMSILRLTFLRNSFFFFFFFVSKFFYIFILNFFPSNNIFSIHFLKCNFAGHSFKNYIKT